MRFNVVLYLMNIILAVEGWPCTSPIRKVFTKTGTDAVLQFTADLSNLNSPRTFYVQFHDNSIRCYIRYNADRTYRTDVINGVGITGDKAGNVDVTLQNVQQNNLGIYWMHSAGLPTRCNCLYILGEPNKPVITINRTPSVGDTSTLTCSSTSNTTPTNHSLTMIYNWRVDNDDNPSGTKYSYSTDRKYLYISNIVKEDASKQLTCTAREDVSDGYTSSTSYDFSFDVYYGPAKVELSPSNTRYEREENSILSPITCKANCHPTCNFKWTKVGQVTDVSNTAVLDLGTLSASKVGTYICTASRSNSATQSLHFTVNVIYGPRNMNFSPNTLSYRRDENFNLPPITCGAECWSCGYSWTGPNSYSTTGQVLDLPGLTKSMTGNYTCTATNTKLSPQRQQVKSVQIEVRYGPNTASLTPGNTIHTVDEGSTLSNIKCEADCFPACKYRWIKDGQTVSNTDTLSLGQVEKSDAGKYTCRATNGDDDSRLFDKTVTVEVRYGPYQSSTYLSPSTQQYTMNEGQILPDITCSADCFPNCTYSWTKKEQKQNLTIDETGVLSLQSLTLNDAASYVCTAKNPRKSKFPETRQELTLNIRYGPDIAKVNVKSPYNLTEGDSNIVIDCSCECFPGCSYTWTNLTNSYIISSKRVLPLEKVTRYMTGEYKCKCQNTAAQYTKSSEKIITINVNEQTLVKSFYVGANESASFFTADEHDLDVTFTCFVSGDPAITVKIVFEENVLLQKSNTNVVKFIRQSVECLHGGIYTCEGRAINGQIWKRNATLFVRCSPRPFWKIRGNISSPLYAPVTLQFVTIAYPEPGPKGFFWYKEKGKIWMPLLSNADFHISSLGLETNLTIWNVSQSDYGHYQVSAVNNIGRYNEYLYLSANEIPSSRSKDCQDKTAVIIAIVFGILCVLLTTYSSFVTILMKRSRTCRGQKTDKANLQREYANMAFKLDDREIHEDEVIRDVIEDEDKPQHQYTDLCQVQNDDSKTYETIQGK